MSYTSQAGRTRVRGRVVTPVQAASYLVGAVFVVVAILGFIPGITTNYDAMQWAGHESGAKLFGVFQVSILHNLVHGVFGLLGLAMARSVPAARGFLVGGGLIYLALWLYGLFVDKGSIANFVPLNTADDWLHLGLGVGMILLGLLLPPRRQAAPGRRATGV
jgi:hypothetical protein